jgi:hypothetical protein
MRFKLRQIVGGCLVCADPAPNLPPALRAADAESDASRPLRHRAHPRMRARKALRGQTRQGAWVLGSKHGAHLRTGLRTSMQTTRWGRQASRARCQTVFSGTTVVCVAEGDKTSAGGVQVRRQRHSCSTRASPAGGKAAGRTPTTERTSFGYRVQVPPGWAD